MSNQNQSALGGSEALALMGEIQSTGWRFEVAHDAASKIAGVRVIYPDDIREVYGLPEGAAYPRIAETPREAVTIVEAMVEAFTVAGCAEGTS